jgi:hypothetical protein
MAGKMTKRNSFNVADVRIVLSGTWPGGNRDAAATHIPGAVAATQITS